MPLIRLDKESRKKNTPFEEEKSANSQEKYKYNTSHFARFNSQRFLPYLKQMLEKKIFESNKDVIAGTETDVMAKGNRFTRDVSKRSGSV